MVNVGLLIIQPRWLNVGYKLSGKEILGSDKNIMLEVGNRLRFIDFFKKTSLMFYHYRWANSANNKNAGFGVKRRAQDARKKIYQANCQ